MMFWFVFFQNTNTKSLLRNMRFLLKYLPRQNASKFAIFLEYENQHRFVFFRATLFYSLMNSECPGPCRHRPGHTLGKK